MPLITKKPATPKPMFPCSVCGANAWWWRQASLFGWEQPGKWLCGRCHPDPRKEQPCQDAGEQ